MGAKGPPLDLEAFLLTCQLEIVMQQLQPWLLLYPDPYDACPTKVREGPHLANRHRHARIAGGCTVDRRHQSRDCLLGNVAEELQREMPLVASEPGELRRLCAQTRRRLVQQVVQFVAELNREEEAHRGQLRSTGGARSAARSPRE